MEEERRDMKTSNEGREGNFLDHATMISGRLF